VFRALDDVTFDVAAGGVVGVIGKNGAGKSTLLKILSRITPPSDGHIDMAGSVGSLIEVGTGFHPELTGLENVYLNGAILGMSKREIDRRLEEITDFAEVDKFLETPVKRYSSGMRVRLAFAVAAHLDPEILIIDEVLSVGDYSFQAKCLDKMRSIAADQGRTVLYVSHNLVTVEHLCPRALLLVDGRLTFDGATDETVAKYLHMFPRAERGPTPGVFDLTAADRSAGDYAAPMFRRLELRPGGGAPSETVRMGERLRIELAVEGLDATPDANLYVAVGSSTSACVFRMSTRMLPLEAAHARRPGETIVIDIPSLLLTPGEYHLDVGAHDKRARFLDEVHRAAEFTVIPADVLGTGYQFSSPKDGHFMVPWEWELRPTSGDRMLRGA
jgi:lipopolysaccharide transport system ATP-binding protein